MYGGIAIANMIRQLSASGHKTTAIVEGLAASIASVIMCACDRVVMSESSLVMIHNCWSVVEGDANELRKTAESMDVMNEAIISFYTSKFDLSRETLKELMDNETWFSGREAESFKFNCEVIKDEAGYRIAAKLKGFDLTKFKNSPKGLGMKIEEQVETQASVETETETETENAEVAAEETVVEEAPVEEPVTEEPKDEEPKAEEPKVEEPETEMIPRAEADKRVSGMQSTMAKKLDALRAEYEEKISGMTAEMETLKKNFTTEIQAKDEELSRAKAELTSLTEKLENTERELHASASALEEKADALTALTSGVLTPSEPTNWKALKGKEFFDWYRKTH